MKTHKWEDLNHKVSPERIRELKKEAIRMTGVELITAERERQVSVEGWKPEHDDKHEEGDLTGAAMAYASAAQDQVTVIKDGTVKSVVALDRSMYIFWPWDQDWWKPSPDPIRNLVKAGALIAAEIDRLQRLK
jgi:hypothetical protein